MGTEGAVRVLVGIFFLPPKGKALRSFVGESEIPGTLYHSEGEGGRDGGPARTFTVHAPARGSEYRREPPAVVHAPVQPPVEHREVELELLHQPVALEEQQVVGQEQVQPVEGLEGIVPQPLEPEVVEEEPQPRALERQLSPVAHLLEQHPPEQERVVGEVQQLRERPGERHRHGLAGQVPRQFPRRELVDPSVVPEEDGVVVVVGALQQPVVQ